ncbi:pyridoxamine kinase [Clostridium vincentii]|uniref:pyridoxal kinase n=1 Tax=Clostridium vincentii TaxID=52704 RepID=A0A2T0BED9_9CLOT|nr:pyridoxamine kinase [Clostridium vincentii]PRR82234.1 Pyridoxine kinase [Clostridium vincentii]
MKPVKRVAVIHDLCGVGKAALTNIMPVLSVMGIEACPIPTMLLSTHTGGFGPPEVVKLPGYIDRCSKHYEKNEIEFHSLFIGYLGTEENIEASIEFIKAQSAINIIVDPIFGDNGKCYSNFNDDYVEKIKGIIPFSTIITPNFTEASLLAGVEYEDSCTEEKIKSICGKLVKLGASSIVITSVPSEYSSLIGMAIYEEHELKLIYKERKNTSYPGTGDIFTSVLIGEMLRETNLYESAIYAHNFVSECIEESMKYDYPTKEGVLVERKLSLLIKIA